MPADFLFAPRAVWDGAAAQHHSGGLMYLGWKPPKAKMSTPCDGETRGGHGVNAATPYVASQLQTTFSAPVRSAFFSTDAQMFYLSLKQHGGSFLRGL